MKARTAPSAMSLDTEASRGSELPARSRAGRRDGVAASRRALVHAPKRFIAAEPASTVHFCIPDEELPHLPIGQALPTWPAGAPMPHVGEVIYLTSTSAWAVRIVIHEFMHGSVRTEIHLVWIGPARHLRDPRSDCVH